MRRILAAAAALLTTTTIMAAAPSGAAPDGRAVPSLCTPARPEVAGPSHRGDVVVSVPQCADARITHYVVAAYLAPSLTAPARTATSPLGLPYQAVDRLRPGTVYRFRVAGVTASQGRGPLSPPSAPTVAPYASLDAFVQVSHRDLAGRPARPAELAEWRERLAAGGLAPVDLLDQLIGARYWQVHGPVTRLYSAAFLRLPDAAGLAYWSSRVRLGASLQRVAASFAASQELEDRYGLLDDQAYVEQVYRNVLGREGDEDGIAFWTDELESGRRTRGDVLAGFSESREHVARLAPTVRIVDVTSGLLDRMPSPEELTAWAPLTRRQLVSVALQQPEYLSRALGSQASPLNAAPVSSHVAYRGYATNYTLAPATSGARLTTGTLPPDFRTRWNESAGRLRLEGAMTFSQDLYVPVTDGTRSTIYTVRGAALQALSGGAGGACVLTNRLEAGCWGSDIPNPSLDLGFADAAFGVDGGLGRACAITGDRTLDCHGGGPEGPPLTDVLDVAVGPGHGCAVIVGGTLRCWGHNDAGQVGDGTTDDRPAAVTVPGLTDIAEVAVGDEHTCARDTSRQIWCWGADGSGQTGTGAARLVPTPVAGATAADLVAAGDHTCARAAGGHVRCWGENGQGQLGDGTTDDRSAPVLVLEELTIGLATGVDHTCAIRQDGTVLCWGDNEDRQLGDGTAVDRLVPTPVTDLDDALLVMVADHATCVLRTSGLATCWGNAVGYPSGTLIGGTGRQNLRPPR